METVEKVLKELGLNEKEIPIYLALLQVGTAPASTLGQRTDITRSTAQYTCQQLAKKGLIAMTQKGNTYLYTAENPERLLTLLEEQKQELEEREEEVQRILGSLKDLVHPEVSLPKIQFFEGETGLRTAYTSILEELSAGDEILSYVRPLEETEDRKGILNIIDDFVEKRAAKGIRLRQIMTAHSIGTEYKKQDVKLLRETRLIPPDIFQEAHPTEILICKDTMYSLSLERGSLFVYRMQHPSLLAVHRGAFELAWERALERGK